MSRIQGPEVQILAEVRSTLGLNSGDLGRLCTYSGLNMWSKCKPFPALEPMYSSDAARNNAAKNAGFALTIPMYAVGLFGQNSHYSEPWTYRKPTGTIGVAPFRALDFKNYEHSLSAWSIGATPTTLKTIFNGFLQVAGTIMAAGDYINLDLDCIDLADTGLLYPNDFNGVPSSLYAVDISNYYVGIAVIGAGSSTYVITDASTVRSHTSESDYAAHIRTTLPSAISNGGAKIVPVLCSARQTTWSQNGNCISLNGAYLSITKVTTSPNLEYAVTWNITSSRVTVDITVTNRTGSQKAFYAYAYLLSGGSDANEHDVGYTGPDYRGEGAHGFLHRMAAAGALPPKSNDVYSSDWQGGYSTPYQRAARYWAMQAVQTTIANNGSLSFSHSFNYSGDDFGSYTSYPPVLIICAYEGGSSVARDFMQT